MPPVDQPHVRGSYRRHLATVGFIAVGAMLMSTGIAQADPSASDVQDEVEKLEEEYAGLAEEYNQANEDHDAAQEKLEDLESDLEDSQEKLDGLREDVRSLASAAYSGADFTSPGHLLSSSGLEDAQYQAADLDYLSQSQEQSLEQYVEEKDKLDRLKGEAEDTESEAEEKLTDAEDAKEEAEEKLAEQQDLLDELTAEEQAAATSGVSGSSNSSPGASYTGPASGNAKTALDFAYAQIGDSYHMGSEGPDVWDCSSLVQAAWREAGVNLPRTTYDQVNAGTPVSWDQMQPGDLIFFYEGPGHVGMYVGNGKMVHASNPDNPVAEVALSSHYQKKFTAAIRP